MRSRSAPPPDPDTLAIAALSHFATDHKILDRFFALTGLDTHSLRGAAGTPAFSAGVLDFVLSDDELVVALATDQDTTPELIAAARQSLERMPVDDDWPPRSADDAFG